MKNAKTVVSPASVAIANLGVGGWYPAGTARLRRLVKDSGCPLELSSTHPPGFPSHEDIPYMAKVMWVERALKIHKRVLWLDCSVVPLKPIKEFISYVLGHPFTQANGVYAYKSGDVVGQTCNDRSLKIAGMSPDDYKKPEFASTLVYLDTTHPVGKVIAKDWVDLARRGAIRGCRDKSPAESRRPEFKYHRQDQSCLTLALHRAEVDHSKADGLGDVVEYSYTKKAPRSHHWMVIAGGEEGLKCWPSANGAA